MGYLQCHQDSMGFADEADDDRSLLHSFLCIFNLKYSALRGTVNFSAAISELSVSFQVAKHPYNVTESLS